MEDGVEQDQGPLWAPRMTFQENATYTRAVTWYMEEGLISAPTYLLCRFLRQNTHT